MHPILGHGKRLLAYLVVWLPAGVLLAAFMVFSDGAAWSDAVVLALPLALCDAFICLAAWYPSRSTPLETQELSLWKSPLWNAAANHLMAALMSSGLWLAAGQGWALLLGRVTPFAAVPELFGRQRPLLLALGVLLYLLAAAAAYVYLAIKASQDARVNALEAEKTRELAARELELARGIQQRLLPPPEAAGGGYRLAARNLAAHFVAGDFYDYFELPDGTLRIAVADVVGKGIAASLITATVKAVLPLVAAERSVVETVRLLNDKLAGELAEREFVALTLASFDPASGVLEVANAGLPDPYLLGAGTDGGVEAIEAPAPRLPLGLRPGTEYGSVVRTLLPGQRVLFLTDGLPEAPIAAGEPLGYEAFEAFLGPGEASRPQRERPGEWLDALIERLRVATVAEQDDDWTALVLERA